MGLPIYLDYYVSHSAANNTMTFVVHTDSTKRQVEPAEKFANELPAALEFENTEGGDVWAFLIAFFFATAALTVTALLTWGIYDDYANVTGSEYTLATVVGTGVGGTIGSLLTFFIIQWIALLILMPGNEYYDV